MASTGRVMASPVKTALETQLCQQGSGPSPPVNLFRTDLALRMLLLSTSAASLAIVLSSNQAKLVYTPLLSSPVSYQAKFTYSTAIIYSVVSTSVVCLYSILTSVTAFVLARPSPPTRLLLLLAILDALMAALMSSTTGAVASVAYIALRGNSHVGWRKFCNVFDTFCRHVGSSIALNLAASSVLVVLVLTSTYSLYRRSR